MKAVSNGGEAPASQSAEVVQLPNFLELITALGGKTPKCSRDIHIPQKNLTKLDSAFWKPTAWLLFRMIGRALDEIGSKLTAAESQNSQLIKTLEIMGQKKRRKVEGDPNQEFAKLKDVRQVKAGMEGPLTRRTAVTRRNEEEDEEEEDPGVEGHGPGCIVVKLQ